MSETENPTPDESPKPTPPPAQNVSEETAPAHLPDDHPLVKALAAQKDEIKALKAKAQRLDEIEDASKTEAQRAAEAQAAAEQRAAEAEARALRREVALDPAGDGTTPALSASDAALLDGITDEDAMRALAKRLAVKAPGSRTTYVPNEGANPRPEPDERQSFADFLVGR